MYQRNRSFIDRKTGQPNGRGITYGTYFRHTVEFSRSGRTPSQAFRTVSGQLVERYSVGFAPSNPVLRPIPMTSDEHAVLLRLVGRDVRPGLFSPRCSNKYDNTQAVETKSNPGLKPSRCLAVTP
jgi:hypothetical protein